MGTQKNAKLEKQDAGRAKVARKRGTRLEAFKANTHTGGADWSSCDAELLKEVVVLITDLGGAVIVGMSRDKGAHSMMLMLDKERQTLWFDGDADLDEKLQEVVGKLEA
jgi:hypothetical protein